MKMKQLRQQKGLSQTELAELTGLSQVAISLIEQGKTKPRKASKQKIEKVLGPVDWPVIYKEPVGEMSAWDAGEKKVRKVLHDAIMSCQRSERRQFIERIQSYLDQYKEEYSK